MRPAGEGDTPLDANRDAPESHPEKEAEPQTSESMLVSSSSSESEFSQADSGLSPSGQASVSSGMIWSLAPEESLPQISNAQAWEMYSLETQARVGQHRHSSVMETTPVSVLKSKPSQEQGQVAKREKSDDFFARPLWPRKAEYLLALVAYTVRPANLWRFVHLWLHKGGVVFLVIYIIMLLFVGIPLLFLEMAAGQRMRRNCMDSWRSIAPWAGGVGYASFIMCFISSAHLNIVNAWIIFYLSHTFQFPLPWEKCPLLKNSSDFDPECAQTTPSVYFWYRETLKVSDRIEDGGPLVLSLSLPFFVSWCIVAAFTIKGLQSLGKGMCVLLSLSYVILFCFFIWSLQLEGAEHGLKHLLVAKMSALYDLSVWSVAGSQAVFHLGLGFGPIACLSSHMPQSNNCLCDAFVLALVNLATLFFITPFILAVLGFWATVLTHRCTEKNTETLLMLVNMGTLPPEAQPPANLPKDPTSTYNAWLGGLDPNIKSLVLSKVPECSREAWILQVKEGPGFAFLSFIEVASFLPRSIFWSVLFLLMLLSLGLGTTAGFMQGLIIPLQDSSSFFRRQTKVLTGGVVVLMFLCGLYFIRPNGVYFIRLLSEYWTPMPIIIILLCENVAVAWACGAKRFLGDMKNLMHDLILRFYSWVWSYLTPVMLLVAFVTILVKSFMKPITYRAWNSSSSTEMTLQYPSWALFLMIILLLLVIAPIPMYVFYCLAHGIPFRASSGDKLTKSSTSLHRKHQIKPKKRDPRERSSTRQ
ncbi:PREDICTED: orphan sodium- and chloride-dependent neurotransmitter transporter NTT5 [Chinchilla lanigera]|uniref:orphan sodium- and chloride-dependent neurotransmitter transporter NTT5 n=1 Tax=Chinchilla lanigera TaxID=34839 RepID=UPI00038EA4B8|nr:PREDICTED: orphan sodium- and chloride-dependent neurotransmitter transporter NTT5 [Chinchilla lanigera]